MKQIGNWVFGSFFRTIGRLLVFILLGIIIANLIDFGSIKDNFRITDLFFDKVDALSLDGTHTGQLKVFNSAPITEFGSACAGATTNNLQFTYVNFNTYIQNLDSDYAVFSFASSEQEYYETYDSSGQSDFYTNRLKNMILKISLVSSNAAWGNCEFQGNQIVCPMQHLATYTALQIAYICPVAGGNEMYFQTMFINDFVEFYQNDKQATTNAIEQQTQQQQQQHEEMMDSNTTEAEEEASSFFEDFDAPDIGGLGAIITAPLNTIRSLLNSSCTNLVLPLPFVNKNITLPCMNSIYTEHFGAFFTIYQTIILAIIAYRCIRSIFFDIHGFTNPNDDRIEVMDL